MTDHKHDHKHFDVNNVKEQPCTKEDELRQKLFFSILKSLYSYSNDEPDQFVATLGISAAQVVNVIEHRMVQDEYKDDQILRSLFLKNFEHGYEECEKLRKAHDDIKTAVTEKFEEILSEIEAEEATKQ